MNRLDFNPPLVKKPFWPKPNTPNEPLYKKPIYHMTQIVGIVCRESVNFSNTDAIVVACESQFTIGCETITGEKMHVVKFNDRREVLVALSGDIPMANRAIRLMSEIAKDRPLDSETTVAKVAEEAIAKLRAEIIGTFQSGNYSLDEQKDFFIKNHYFALMIAYFWGDIMKERPSLFTIAIEPGLAQPEFPCSALGSASHLARLNLNKLSFLKTIRWELAVPLAIHTIEQIKGSDVYCGGAVKVGIVQRHGCTFYTEKLVNDFIVEIRKIQAKLDSKYKAELVATIHRIGKKGDRAYEKWLKKNQLSGVL